MNASAHLETTNLATDRVLLRAGDRLYVATYDGTTLDLHVSDDGGVSWKTVTLATDVARHTPMTIWTARESLEP